MGPPVGLGVARIPRGTLHRSNNASARPSLIPHFLCTSGKYFLSHKVQGVTRYMPVGGISQTDVYLAGYLA